MNAFIVLSFKEWFRGRGSFLGPFVFLLMMFLIEGSFWHSLTKSEGSIGTYTSNQVILYAFLALLFSQITACIGEPDQLSDKIESGELDRYLLRPLSFLQQMSGMQIGLTAARFIAFLPLIFYLLFLFKSSPSASDFLFFAISIFLASLLNFLMNQLLSMATFYLHESYALVILKETLFWILSGALIPLDLFSPQVATVLKVLPSAAVVFLPAKVLMGHASGLQVLGLQFFYIVIFVGLNQIVWRRSVRHYQAYGG
jgi:ABC-2 type transport system permease protein